MAQSSTAFVSYSREDAAFVLLLTRDLRDAGASLWLDQLDIHAGQRWDSSVERALNECERVLLILSPASVASQNVRDEVSYAMDEGKAIIPVLQRDCKIPLRLRRLQYIDYRSSYETGLAELLLALGTGEAPLARAKRETARAATRTAALRIDDAAVNFTPRRYLRYLTAMAGFFILAVGAWIWRGPSVGGSPPPKSVATQADGKLAALAVPRREEASAHPVASSPVAKLRVDPFPPNGKPLDPQTQNRDIAAGPEPGTGKLNPADGQRYKWIPPGGFRMGCSAGDNHCESFEKPAVSVEVTKGFWIGETEVTQAAYQRVVRSSPSKVKVAEYPVEFVSWVAARSYCAAIGGRLPTEAEWEYAARAGTTGSRYGTLDRIAWHGGNSLADRDLSAAFDMQSVRKKSPNAWGLYDMLGNASEWTNDWWSKKLRGGRDPGGPARGDARVTRGGNAMVDPEFVRVSIRDSQEPGEGYIGVGFRCVCSTFE